MLGVLSTPAAILGELQPFPGIGLALGSDVIASLALLAGKRDWGSLI
jgi:hypothetical protein